MDSSIRTLRTFPSKRALRSRSEEHTSELQSRLHLVCRLLLEKKKKKNFSIYYPLNHMLWQIDIRTNNSSQTDVRIAFNISSTCHLHYTFKSHPHCCDLACCR